MNEKHIWIQLGDYLFRIIDESDYVDKNYTDDVEWWLM
jgi:hypothetical protein